MAQDPAPVAAVPLVLSPVLDLEAATMLRQTLAERVRSGIVLDASAVERLQTPCVQVLHAAAMSCHDNAADFVIVSASDSFRAALADLGLSSHLERWMARDGQKGADR